MLKITNLTTRISRKEIIRDFSHTFQKGKVYALMGPNGSGKSTLAHTVMGNRAFSVKRGSQIVLGKKPITRIAPEKRAQAGLFLSYQAPLALEGVSVRDLLRVAMKDRGISAIDLRNQVNDVAAQLSIAPELLSRSLNDGFSGGERKKMEVLQAAILDPQVLFLDEIDTGVDVDALKTIATFLKNFHTKEKTFIIITHYNRILKHLQPDQVLVLKEGTLAKKGNKNLAKEIEKKGYDWI